MRNLCGSRNENEIHSVGQLTLTAGCNAMQVSIQTNPEIFFYDGSKLSYIENINLSFYNF